MVDSHLWWMNGVTSLLMEHEKSDEWSEEKKDENGR
jgi:hypothetical protein